ncbi:hypothetical protein GIB67_012354 [Kingdonia uniflora]|uniref:Uncharacterized protein n=1 Tax=Kingdonia uniflora TaxID=39325 RepID=A0A7J7MVU1_9MAGN|nr:hypothetical protein GIB67_012354 [Kingdonia uniflora]
MRSASKMLDQYSSIDRQSGDQRSGDDGTVKKKQRQITNTCSSTHYLLVRKKTLKMHVLSTY